MELDSPLTIIGLIATVLSMTFALAALLNSRRKQMQARKLASPTAGQTANAPPLPSVRQVIQQRLSGTPAAKPAEHPAKPSFSVFKQAGPHGAELPANASYADDEYIWE